MIYDLITVYQIRQSYHVINNIRRNTKITRIVIEVLIYDSRIHRILAALYEISNRVGPPGRGTSSVYAILFMDTVGKK